MATTAYRSNACTIGTVENGAPAPVVSSAGALVEGLHVLGAKRIAVVAPYLKPLTKLVVDYIENEGITVTDWLALEIADTLTVWNDCDVMFWSHLQSKYYPGAARP
jgi:maleate cis-trans isomerase